jgi:hypothetical protein
MSTCPDVWLRLMRHVCPYFYLQKGLFGFSWWCERYMMYTADYDYGYDLGEFFSDGPLREVSFILRWCYCFST